jgi:hypothetical protein
MNSVDLQSDRDHVHAPKTSEDSWWDKLFYGFYELLTEYKYFRYGLLSICVGLIIFGIVLLSIFIPDYEHNGGWMAMGISSIIIGGIFGFFIYRA